MATNNTRDIVLRMEGKLDTALEKLDKHDVDLNGNGKPGLKADVKALQDDMGDFKKTASGLAWGLGIPFVLGFGGFIWALITHAIIIGK